MKKSLMLLFGLAVMIIFATNVNAVSAKTTVDKFIADDNININETVNSDLYFAGNNVTINGDVAGDVIGMGMVTNITGDVTNNIRVAGSNINFSNVNANNITVAGSTISFINVKANRVYAGGTNIEFTGEANNINFSADQIIIDGTINGISNIYANEVVIKDTAIINAKLNVKAVNKIEYDGDVNKDNIVYTQIDGKDSGYSFNLVNTLWGLLFQVITMTLIAFILNALFKKYIKESIANLKNKPITTVLFGLLLLIAIPILAILTMITVIGIPIAVIAVFGYITSLIIASAFSALALSDILFDKVELDIYFKILLSVLIISILTIIPVISLITCLICFGYTLGSVKLFFNKKAS